mgnify:CR=1 FL=1
MITVTYGNRHYDDALIELFDLVREQGFRPLAAAALVGQHTYGHIQVGRTGCGLCVRECPEGAIGEDCRTIDPEACISCFRCIRICPTGAKNMDVPAYQEFAEEFSRKLSQPRKNEYFL